MKKQYAVTFRNTNPRLNQTIRYLTKIVNGYPHKSAAADEAVIFRTKAEAKRAIASIDKNNLYHTELNIISA